MNELLEKLSKVENRQKIIFNKFKRLRVLQEENELLRKEPREHQRILNILDVLMARGNKFLLYREGDMSCIKDLETGVEYKGSCLREAGRWLCADDLECKAEEYLDSLMEALRD